MQEVMKHLQGLNQEVYHLRLVAQELSSAAGVLSVVVIPLLAIAVITLLVIAHKIDK